ncbi:MAG TPA: MFS transporter [Gemmatimonadales bacterium]|nr:MFS transporter [Gemmatimonadales bacterium]
MPPRPASSQVRWKILALLFLASFIAYILRTNMSIVGEAMMGELGISQVQLGVVLASFAWGYAIFQFPGGVFGDRIGGRKALAVMLVAWGVLTLATALIPSTAAVGTTAVIAVLSVIRFGMGVVQAPLYPVTSGGTTSLWFPVSGWALPNGLTNAGLTLGSAAAGPLVAWLMTTVGWRLSFVVTAPLALLLAGVWWWYARDRPSEHAGVSQQELDLINAGREAPPAPVEPGAWKRLLANREILLLTLSYFCSNYVFYFFFNWLYIYLVQNRGFKVLEGGWYASIPWIVGSVGAVIGGIWCDTGSRRIGPRMGTRIPAIAGLLAAAAFMYLAARADEPRLVVALLALCLGAQQLTEGPFWAAAIGVSGRQASAGCGVLNTGGNVVGGLGALMVPLIVQSVGWPAALASASVFAVVGAVIWFFIRADQAIPG